MKKLVLNVEALEIETFDVASAEAEQGTVEAFGTFDTCDPRVGTCFGYTCYETCNQTCNTCDPRVGTCFGYTCYATCTL